MAIFDDKLDEITEEYLFSVGFVRDRYRRTLFIKWYNISQPFSLIQYEKKDNWLKCYRQSIEFLRIDNPTIMDIELALSKYINT